MKRTTVVLACAVTACDPQPFDRAGDRDEQTEPTLGVECLGKCDGLSELRSLLHDPSELSLDDLLEAGIPFAIDGLNDLLSSTPIADIEIEEPAFYGADEVEALVSGLATRFGEKELTTEVNAARLRHLGSSEDTTYAEVAVNIDSSLASDFGLSWEIEVPGLDEGDALAAVGFEVGAGLSARIIRAYPFEADEPLNHIAALRGFAVPTSLEDLTQMRPGEVVGVRGDGRLGVNLGVGVPLLVAEPTGALAYTIALTAGLRTHLEGTLDVQLVRLEGGEVVVDVGIEEAKVRAARVAIEDGWGVQGLLELEVEIAGIEVDLGRLVEKALERQLNRKLDLVSAHAEHSTEEVRTSIARFRIDLETADPKAAQAAIAQALRGDVRLAQGLSARGEPGVTAEFDFLRSGLTTTGGAGVGIFGLKFFKEKIETEGEIIVQTPGGVRTFLFDSLHKSGGKFTSTQGYTRVGLGGLVFDAASGGAPRGETNLVVQLAESDKGMERDKLVDQLDSLVVALAGKSALAALEGPANDLERFAQGLCPGAEIHDSCILDAVVDPRLAGKREAAHAAFTAALGDTPASLHPLLDTVVEHKLLAQGTYEIQNNGFIGPSTTIAVDYRLDDGALQQMAATVTGRMLADAVADTLHFTEIERDDDADDIAEDRADARKDSVDELADMAAHYDAFAADYQRLASAEEAVVETVGAIGARTLELRFTIDAAKTPVYAEATTRSLAAARAELVAGLFDQLRRDAKGLGPHPEQVAAYGLLAVTPPERMDLRIDVHHGLKDTFNGWRKPYREADYPAHVGAQVLGEDTTPIDGGLFDVDALLELE